MNAERRFFWWPHGSFDVPWWKLWLWGSDEWGRRDLGIRLPGGMLFVGLWRFRDWRGPCRQCGQWEPEEAWDGAHCQNCAAELYDYARGCVCPSVLDDVDLDEEWPAPGCALHAHLVRR